MTDFLKLLEKKYGIESSFYISLFKKGLITDINLIYINVNYLKMCNLARHRNLREKGLNFRKLIYYFSGYQHLIFTNYLN